MLAFRMSSRCSLRFSGAGRRARDSGRQEAIDDLLNHRRAAFEGVAPDILVGLMRLLESPGPQINDVMPEPVNHPPSVAIQRAARSFRAGDSNSAASRAVPRAESSGGTTFSTAVSIVARCSRPA